MIDLKKGDKVMMLRTRFGRSKFIYTGTVKELTERKVLVSCISGGFWCLINRFTGEVLDSSFGINKWEKICE